MKAILLFCAILFATALSAQRYSSNKEKFVKELSKSFPIESFQHFLKKEFAPFVISSDFSNNEFERLVKRCNYLHDRNFSGADIMALIHIAMDQKKSVFPTSFVSKWHKLFDLSLIHI